MTPHNQAQPGEIAPIVLMPGDPLRAKYIAEHYLDDAVCFNTVRNMFGYTGTYKGTRISVMGSGMGMPSIGIYSYELYTTYHVEAIIRIGSCGAYSPDLHTFDILAADSCWSPSTYAQAQSGDTRDIQYPDQNLLHTIEMTAQQLNIPLHIGRLHSSDVFYYEEGINNGAAEHNCMAVEMESFALFHNADITHKKAACLCTVSDSFVYDEDTTPQQRETSFQDMMKLALEAARKAI
ncbi:purine-nucleoside phosphorylase [Catenisphaera adipataccumulans]|jgi:purine-nucleoside phosphorylase|uniref:Uridine phosphorylase n=1 Tax=Catenisphaera adipataccumulans TaxID=700500 RepID=A0A7W8FXW1_9FIRM|nr:purine-nucleoside phosphorylase [Catenisphaera adipataccumulans]MBB5183382.1 purine-nucleoside phosphorylase [Catenisphaera adipataccumulans]